MAIRTNLTSLQPRREVYKREMRLVSGGYSNRSAWPDGKITIFPWDNELDEFLFEISRTKTADESIYALVERCCHLNGATVDQLVSSEVPSILLASRTLGMGGRVRYRTVCPSCRNSAEEQITVPDELGVVGEKAPDYPGYDEITLPDSKDVVRIRPLLVSDDRRINERTPEQKAGISDNLLRLIYGIVSVGGGAPDNADEVRRWYESISPGDARFLDQKRMELSPRLNTKIGHVCDKCRRTFDWPLTFDMEFFR